MGRGTKRKVERERKERKKRKNIPISLIKKRGGGASSNTRKLYLENKITFPSELAVIRLGEWDLSTEMDCTNTSNGSRFCAPPVQDFDFEEVIEHPSYDNRTLFSDDIALIRLSKPINFLTSAGKGVWRLS